MAETPAIADAKVIDQTPAPAANPEPAPQEMEVVKLEEAPAPVVEPAAMEQPPVAPLQEVPVAQPIQAEGGAVAEQPAAAVEQAEEPPKKKQRAKKRPYPIHGMYPPSAEQIRKASGAPKPISRTDINKLIKERFASTGSIVRGLFTFEDCAVTNDLGDVRFGNCVLVSPIGPFAVNESIRIIDWLPSISTILLSKTARVSDTVAMEIAPAAINSQIPLL